jgi:hypothetical protein
MTVAAQNVGLYTLAHTLILSRDSHGAVRCSEYKIPENK